MTERFASPPAGLFEVILTEEDAVISDELNHASIIDGAAVGCCFSVTTIVISVCAVLEAASRDLRWLKSVVFRYVTFDYCI